MWRASLKKMKAESGLTTSEIAAKSGIPEPTLEKLFAGATKDPKLPTMQKLVHFFGYTLDDLYGAKEKAPAPSEDSAEANKVSFEGIEQVLVSMGWIKPGQDLSDTDLDFLMSVGRIVEAWFRKGEQRSGE